MVDSTSAAVLQYLLPIWIQFQSSQYAQTCTSGIETILIIAHVKQVAGKVACGVFDGDKDKEKWKQFHESDCVVSWETGWGSNDSAAATQQ